MQFTALSEAERAFFEEQGYLIVRQALSLATVAAIVAVADRLLASPDRRDRQTDDGGRYDGFRNVISRDPVFLPLLTNSRTLPLVLQLMSPHLQLHTSHLIYKAPDQADAGRRRNPGWHRDINTCPKDLGPATPRLEIKVAYQLSDASVPDCGQTLVAPGSHLLRGPLPVDAHGDPLQIVEPMLQAGDALLFENRTYHAGGTNRSGRVRKNVMFGYSYRWMRPDDYVQQSPELLADCDPIQCQLLGGSGGLSNPDGSFNAGGSARPLGDWCRDHGIGAAWQHAPAARLS